LILGGLILLLQRWSPMSLPLLHRLSHSVYWGAASVLVGLGILYFDRRRAKK